MSDHETGPVAGVQGGVEGVHGKAGAAVGAVTGGLQVEIAETNQAWSVVVRGDVDIESAPQLSVALESAIARGARLVALDLAGVDFLDSSGLRVIVAAAEDLRAADGSLFVQGASPAVLRVLEVTGLIDRLRRSTLDEP